MDYMNYMDYGYRDFDAKMRIKIKNYLSIIYKKGLLKQKGTSISIFLNF